MLFLRLLLASLCILALTAEDASDVGTVTVPTGTLSNGAIVPLVGLGCASGVREAHVTNALSIGYRFFDTAQSYNWGYHEDEVGNAIADFKQNHPSLAESSDSIFVQTKIHPEDLGYEATKRAVNKSLKRLKLSSIDSVLIHKPRCWEGACTKVPEGTWQDSWKALEEFYEAGIISKSIGICDVSSVALLEELLSQKIKPHVIQNWMDPLHQDKFMRDRIQSEGILYQAYSSLGTQWYHHKGHAVNPVTHHPTLLEIAASHGVDVDVGQVVVNWATTRHGISVLPASTNPSRQEGNLFHSFRFVLSEEDLDRIDALDGRVPKANTQKEDDNDNGISIVFRNDAPEDADAASSAIDVFWVDPQEQSEILVGSANPGRTVSLKSYHGHTFRFKNHPGGNTDSSSISDSDSDSIAYSEYTVDEDEEVGNRRVHVISAADEDEDEL